jgi:iduronate 2-sulfatase
MYDTSRLLLPEIPRDEMSDIPLMGKAIAYGYTPRGGWGDVSARPGFLKELVHSYLACVTFTDDQVGRVLSALEQSPYADNTLVVLWSDHGQHLGEKRHFRKQALWEEATRVPLIFRYPEKFEPGVCDGSVSLLDLYPTLIDLCGLPRNDMLEGNSLVPLIEDPGREWEYPVLSVWGYRNYSVRSKHWRYIQYRDGTEELYDHRNDPGEHINLASLPGYDPVKAGLVQWLPAEHALPAGTTEWTGDRYEDRIKDWQRTGIPGWLE